MEAEIEDNSRISGWLRGIGHRRRGGFKARVFRTSYYSCADWGYDCPAYCPEYPDELHTTQRIYIFR
jgi:hypothetical protein